MAEGKLDLVVQFSNKIWDIHPIIPILRSAGAIVTTWNNQSPVLAGTIVVANNKKIIFRF